MTLRLRAAFAAVTFALASTAGAQQINFDTVQVKATELGPNTFMLEGAGGNVTLAAGKDGAIMVDSQFAPMHPKLKAAVAALTGVPVKYVVNTHYHGDHVGGNAAFQGDGATAVAHENVAKRLAAGTTNAFTGNKVAPVAKEAVPRRTYRSREITLEVQGRTARVGNPPNAHTDGDSYVYFADTNVLATGDIVTLGRYPLVDFTNGGSINGLIAALDLYLKIANDRTKVVPGHGPVASKTTLASYRVMLVTARDRVARLISEGRSEKEAIAGRPFEDLDKQTGANPQQSDVFVRGIYNSLKLSAK